MYNIEEKIKTCSLWFKDHDPFFYSIALNDNLDDQIHILNWKKPGTNIYCVKYIIRNNCLFVTGDLECSVYRFSNNIGWHSLASMDSGYFGSKCDASATGRFCNEWNEEKCISIFNEKMKEYEGEKPSFMTNEEFESFKEQAEQESYTRESWGRFVQDNYDTFYDNAYDYGEDISLVCVAHLRGIQMALEKHHAKQNAQKTNSQLDIKNEMNKLFYSNQFYAIHADRYNTMKKIEKNTKNNIFRRILNAIRNEYE